ncbi:hypothetical protein AA313_de0205467 [Arthrobotrys entomopaga]|nr:hypothetical protein AA313_de0205467 [Arthrobotrys entomopaga]
MSGWLNMSWFGGGGGEGADAKTAILKLRGQKETLEKKETYLETKIKEEEDKARKYVTTNKNMAMNALKKKKQYETQLDSTRGSINTLDAQITSIESANLNYQTLEAMKVANTAMKAMNKKHNIDKIDDLLDSLEDQMANSNQISERIGQIGQTNSQVNEDELMDEFAELQQQVMDQQMLNAGPTPVSVPGGAEKNKQPAAREEEDEEEELRKLQAEMAM